MRASVLQQLTCGRRRPYQSVLAPSREVIFVSGIIGSRPLLTVYSSSAALEKLAVRIATARETDRDATTREPLQLRRANRQIRRHGRLHVPLLRRRVPRCQGRHPLPRDVQLLGAQTRPN